MSKPAASTKPVVCTLSDRKRSSRKLEWSEIWSMARTTNRIEGGVAATFDLALADEIDDLAQREIGCCGSWLDIATQRSVETIRLEVTTVNPEGVNVIDQLAGFSRR